MDQIKATQQGLEFVYILPFSKRHALIELTYFSTSPIVPDTLKSKLYTIIQLRTNNQSFRYMREEMGILPMYSIDLNKTKPVSTHLHGGIAGGAMRASTGYSFLNSQRWANDLAGQIVSQQRICHRPPISAVYHILDTLFLRVQHSMPALGMSLYSRLFQSLETKTFINFMSERASLLEILRVIWAMPKRLFVKTLVQSYCKPRRSIDE
jgi:lycopene beta-cyclase